MLEEIKNELKKTFYIDENDMHFEIAKVHIDTLFEILDKYKDKEIQLEDGTTKYFVVKIPELKIENIKNYNNQPDYKTISQIAKMISSGEIPEEVYDKYLSECPIGFMKYEDLLKYLTSGQSDYKNAWEELKTNEMAVDKISLDIMQELEQKYNLGTNNKEGD